MISKLPALARHQLRHGRPTVVGLEGNGKGGEGKGLRPSGKGGGFELWGTGKRNPGVSTDAKTFLR